MRKLLEITRESRGHASGRPRPTRGGLRTGPCGVLGATARATLAPILKPMRDTASAARGNVTLDTSPGKSVRDRIVGRGGAETTAERRQHLFAVRPHNELQGETPWTNQPQSIAERFSARSASRSAEPA